jgi:hypothetical protein
LDPLYKQQNMFSQKNVHPIYSRVQKSKSLLEGKAATTRGASDVALDLLFLLFTTITIIIHAAIKAAPTPAAIAAITPTGADELGVSTAAIVAVALAAARI